MVLWSALALARAPELPGAPFAPEPLVSERWLDTLLDPDPLDRALGARRLDCGPGGATVRVARELWCEVGGVREGPYESWDREGRAEVTGGFRRGERHGLWTEWTTSGRPALEHRYAGGTLHGPWRRYDEDGRVTGAGRFVRGRREGRWREDAPPHHHIRKQYRRGLAEGRWLIDEPEHGQRYELSFRAGRPHGPWRYRADGPAWSHEIRGHYRHGRRQGRWISIEVDRSPARRRRVASGRFRRDEPVGRWEERVDGRLQNWLHFDGDGLLLREGGIVADDTSFWPTTAVDFVVTHWPEDDASWP